MKRNEYRAKVAQIVRDKIDEFAFNIDPIIVDIDICPKRDPVKIFLTYNFKWEVISAIAFNVNAIPRNVHNEYLFLEKLIQDNE